MSAFHMPALKDKTVIIADDDDITCGLLRNVLRSIGMRVVAEARDGQEALAKFQKHQPQVICLDIEMPEMDGLAVLGKIRDANAATVVLMISGVATGTNVRQAQSSRADGFIVKPLNTAKVAEEIQRGLLRAQERPGEVLAQKNPQKNPQENTQEKPEEKAQAPSEEKPTEQS
jgi:two-component system chemotaxis response regulator CheY